MTGYQVFVVFGSLGSYLALTAHVIALGQHFEILDAAVYPWEHLKAW